MREMRLNFTHIKLHPRWLTFNKSALLEVTGQRHMHKCSGPVLSIGMRKPCFGIIRSFQTFNLYCTIQIYTFIVVLESFWDNPLHCLQESFPAFNGETLPSKLINLTQRAQCSSLSSIFGMFLDFLQASGLFYIHITKTFLLLPFHAI